MERMVLSEIRLKELVEHRDKIIQKVVNTVTDGTVYYQDVRERIDKLLSDYEDVMARLSVYNSAGAVIPTPVVKLHPPEG